MMRTALVWLAAAAVAQTPSGSIVGRVTDAGGTAIPNAQVEIIHLDTNAGRTISTRDEGDFLAVQLPVGAYRVVVSKDGFRTLIRPKLTLQLEQTLRLDLALTPGNPAEPIELAEAGEEIGPDAEDASRGETTDQKEIEETPLEGRDVQNLGLQAAGVLKSAAGGTGSDFSINGARSDNTNFMIDGFQNRNVRGGGQQIRVPLDAMREFKMQVSSYSAEMGRLGGGVMNVVLRTGTNRYHGSLFEYVRNDLLDARNFFDAEKTKLRRNQFGATLNGPVRVPRLYNGRDRTFFVMSWESYRQRQGTTRLTRVPTGLERDGDFSQTLDIDGRQIALRDPLASGQCQRAGASGCFPESRVPRSRWSPVAQKATPYYPWPNAPGVNNFRSTLSDADNWDSFLVKVDHRFSSADAVAARFAGRLNDKQNPFSGSGLPGFGEMSTNRQWLAGISYSKAIRAAFVNDLRAGLVRTTQHDEGFRADANYSQALGLPSSAPDRHFWGFPRITVRDLAAIGDPAADPMAFVVNNWQLSDTLVWARRAHTLRFGGELLRPNFAQDNNSNLRGTFNFLGRWTNVPYADFLLGLLNNATRQNGFYRNYLRNNIWGAFLQEDWRASGSLTFNLGVRYEIYSPPADKYGRWTNFDPQLGKVVAASIDTVPDFAALVARTNLAGLVTTAGEAGLPPALVYSNNHNLAPRFGFAWRPRRARGAVVRSGYGIFYSSTNLTPIRGDLGAAFPFLIKETFSRRTNQPLALTLDDPFPEALKTVTDVNNVSGYQTRPRASYLQAWNFTVEREARRGLALELAYLGSKGTHLGRKYNVNQPFRSAELTSPFPRPYPGFGTISYYSFGSNSSYQAAVVGLRVRLAGGGMLRLNYTLAKSLDESSQISGASDGGYGGAQDARNLRLERGRSDWDVRHAFSANLHYQPPLFSGNRWLGGWRLSSTSRVYSGAPFTPQTSNVQADLGEADRPDRIAFGALSNPTPDRWFDLAAFPVVPTGAFRFGNSGRNILNGPGFLNINVGLMKMFALGEDRSFQFRAEVFDILNHPNFELPTVNVNAANGGTITQAKEGRRMQVALKFAF
jgi:hypothetical protein